MERSKLDDEEDVVLAFENIKNRVVHNIQKPVRSMADLESFLKGWWCRHYGRPYKDPMVEEYTLEELLIEYLDIYYRNNPKKLEEEKPDSKAASAEDEAWIEKMTKQAEAEVEEDEEDEEVDVDRSEQQRRYKARLREGFTVDEPAPAPEALERHVDFIGKG